MTRPHIMLSLLVLLSLTYPTQATGQQPPIQVIPPGDDVIAPIRKGQPAPFDGQLFNSDTAMRWGFFLQQYKYRLVWDVKYTVDMCTQETTYRDKLLANEKERSGKVETMLTAELKKSEEARMSAEEELRNPPWYSSPVFGAAVGVVAAGAVFALAVYGVSATR